MARIRVTDAGEIDLLGTYFGTLGKDITMDLILFTNDMWTQTAGDAVVYEDFTQPPASCGYTKVTFTLANMPTAAVFTSSVYEVPTAVWPDALFTFTGPIPIVALGANGNLHAGTASVYGYALVLNSPTNRISFWEEMTSLSLGSTTPSPNPFTPLANQDSLKINLLLQIGNGNPT